MPDGWAERLWQLALTALVAPFYLGLYVVTLIGAAFDRRGQR